MIRVPIRYILRELRAGPAGRPGLLSQAADAGATRTRRASSRGDDSTDALRASLIALLQRRWGMVALRSP